MQRQKQGRLVAQFKIKYFFKHVVNNTLRNGDNVDELQKLLDINLVDEFAIIKVQISWLEFTLRRDWLRVCSSYNAPTSEKLT